MMSPTSPQLPRDYALMVGMPARIAGWVRECGEKMKFESDRAKCPACSKQYRRTGKEKVVRESV